MICTLTNNSFDKTKRTTFLDDSFSKKNSIAFALLLLAAILEETIRSFVQLSSVPIPELLISAIDIVAYLLLYLFIFLHLNKKQVFNSFKQSILLVLLLFLVYCFSLIINNKILVYLSSFLNILFKAVLYIFFGKMLRAYKMDLKTFRPFYFIVSMYCIITVLFPMADDYYMIFSYYVLPWCVIAYCSSSRLKSKFDFLFFLLFFAAMLLSGARMPCLIVLVFIAFDFIFLKKNDAKGIAKKLVLLVFAFSIVLTLLIFGSSIAQFLESKNVSSRFLTKLLNGQLLESVQRVKIYDAISSAIRHDPYSFKGLFSDRIYLGETYIGTNELNITIDGSDNFAYLYSHNLVLETIFEFGVVLGSLFLATLAIKSLKTIVLMRSDTNGVIALLFSFSVGLFPLLVSNSYLIYPLFWFFLGFIFDNKLAFQIRL